MTLTAPTPPVSDVAKQQKHDELQWAVCDLKNQESLDAGMTPEELDDSEMVSYLFEYIHQDTGLPMEQVVADINAASWEQIHDWQKKYMPDWKPRRERGTLGYVRG